MELSRDKKTKKTPSYGAHHHHYPNWYISRLDMAQSSGVELRITGGSEG